MTSSSALARRAKSPPSSFASSAARARLSESAAGDKSTSTSFEPTTKETANATIVPRVANAVAPVVKRAKPTAGTTTPKPKRSAKDAVAAEKNARGRAKKRTEKAAWKMSAPSTLARAKVPPRESARERRGLSPHYRASDLRAGHCCSASARSHMARQRSPRESSSPPPPPPPPPESAARHATRRWTLEGRWS